MRRVFLPLLYLCALPLAARAETVAELIAQLEQTKPELAVVVQVDETLLRSVATVEVVRAWALALPQPGNASYYQVAQADGAGKRQVALLGLGPAAAAQRAPATSCETNCTAEHLSLVDVSCAPPHGSGPDGRAWVHLVCGEDKAPTPYDWQLARLSGAQADIFAWHSDPTYAYVQGATGSYQASAHTALGQLDLNFALPTSCASRR